MTTRTIVVEGLEVEFLVLPAGDFDPARTGGYIQMTGGDERRTVYLDLGRLPLDQQDLDERDSDLLAKWWLEAAQPGIGGSRHYR